MTVESKAASVAEQWGEWALSLSLADIPNEARQHAKRLIIDTLGCAIAGSDSEAVTALLRAINGDLACRGESTIFGAGTQTTAQNAILANGAMTRFLDANDVTPGGHTSESIPAILAVGELAGASGEEVLVAIVVAYELSVRFHLAIQGGMGAGGRRLEDIGWNQDLRAGCIMPPAFGRLLGLTPTQIADAIGIAASRSFLLGIIDAPREQNTLAKNVRFPLTAYQALVAVFLARNGLTGPRRVFEGSKGIREVLLAGEMDLERLTRFGDEWFILHSGIKAFSACHATHGHLRATVDLVAEHNIDAHDVVAVEITASPRTARHTGDPTARRRVSNKETADHSSFYVTAMALLRGQVGPEEYSRALYDDPEVHRLMDATTVAVDEKYASVYPAARVKIRLQDGRELEREVIRAKGHRLNPMTDDEVVGKFDMMARSRVPDERRRKIVELVRGIEDLASLEPLIEQLRFPLTP